MYELPRGTAVGKYEILRKLATGGMAEIYLARVSGQAGFEKLVVLKRILPQIAEDPRLVQMFLDEARLAATLRHPNIADVYDVGDDDGSVFFTMEFVHGQDVRAIRQDAKAAGAPIPLGVALAIVHGTASALEHAHDLSGPDGKPLGLVHRDVSTSNVMVSYDGAIKLLDFGIARATSSTHKTQTGTLKGKIAYMSPEQCKGQPLDRRSDLFSLGIVMYELTVGRRPFRGDNDFAIMDQIVYQGAPEPASQRPDYPPELAAIVMKLLARDPKLRYPTGEDLLHELDEYVAKHGLWQSPRAIGKYMRSLFAEKIEAWEAAEQQGVPFAQHMVQAITSQSQRVELVTPSVSFPGVQPRPSQRHLVPRVPTNQIDERITTPEARPVAVPPEPVYPPIKTGGGTMFLRVVLALLVIGGAAAAGFFVMKKQPKKIAPEASVPAEQPAAVEQPKVEQPKVEQPKIEQPKVEQPTVPTVEKPTLDEAKGSATKVDEVPTVDTKTDETKSVAETAIVETKVAPPTGKKTPVVKKTVKKTVVKKAALKTDAKPDTKTDTKPDTKPDTKTETKQDPGKFDPDSPFLPQ